MFTDGLRKYDPNHKKINVFTTQHFVTGVFDATRQEESPQVIINADGIYLTTYSVLSLNLQLIQGGHYCDPSLPLPMSQVCRMVNCACRIDT